MLAYEGLEREQVCEFVLFASSLGALIDDAAQDKGSSQNLPQIVR
jgi:hypothetical protein